MYINLDMAKICFLVSKKKTITNTPGKTFTKAPARRNPPTCLLIKGITQNFRTNMQHLLNIGNNKKSSPVKGQKHQTTRPVINPHSLQFGEVDWSVLGQGAVDFAVGEQEGCGCLPKIKTPDTGNSSTTTLPASIKPKEKPLKSEDKPFMPVKKSAWKPFSSTVVVSGLLGGGPKRRDTTRGDIILGLSKQITSAKGKKSDEVPPASPVPSISSSLDKMLVDLCEGASKSNPTSATLNISSVEKAKKKHLVLPQNKKNECPMTSYLFLLFANQEFKLFVIGKIILSVYVLHLVLFRQPGEA